MPQKGFTLSMSKGFAPLIIIVIATLVIGAGVGGYIFISKYKQEVLPPIPEIVSTEKEDLPQVQIKEEPAPLKRESNFRDSKQEKPPISVKTPLVLVATTTSSIGAGMGHTCVILIEHTIACWGDNFNGAISSENILEFSRPVRIPGTNDAVAVSAGIMHTCFIRKNGTVWCWGNDEFGQLGNDALLVNHSRPVQVFGITDAVAIDANALHTCALLKDQTAVCWGRNDMGQIGNGSKSNNQPIPVPASGIYDAVAIAAGYYNSCAVLSTGLVKCWGSLYTPTGSGIDFPLPINIEGITNAISVTAGNAHTCVLLSDGSVKCWGDDQRGQIGDGGLIPPLIIGKEPVPLIPDVKPLPTAVSDITDAIKIAAGGFHTCAILKNKTVRCWGWDAHGQIGNGVPIPQLPANERYAVAPSDVIGIKNAIELVSGADHNCALLDTGEVYCWGADNLAQLGNVTNHFPQVVPVKIKFPTGL